MVNRLRSQQIDRALDLLRRLSRNRQHQIGRNVGKARPRRLAERLDRPGGVVLSAQRLQGGFKKRLHPEGDPGKPARAQLFQHLRPDRAGIGLDGNFPLCRAEPLLHRREQAVQAPRAEQDRRSAAEVNGVRRNFPRNRSRLNGADGGGEEAVIILAAPPPGIEIAVGAFPAAERNVQINPDRLTHRA